jgi:hypothetical protein
LKRNRRQFVLAAIVLGLIVGPGCGVIQVNVGGAENGSGLDGALMNCRNWRGGNGAASIEADIATEVCSQRQSAIFNGSEVERRHKTFDDRRPNRVVAALNVLDCAKTQGLAKVAIGMCTYYAELFDEASLKAEVAQLKISDDMKSTFVWASLRSQSVVASFAKRFDPRRKHLYIDVPRAVIDKRRAYFDAHADLYKELDALEAQAKNARAAKQAPQEIVSGFVALRGKYLTQCGNADCRFDPFVIEATQELVRLGVAANDQLLARAENYLLREPAAGRHLFAVETGTAVYEATSKESRDYDLYERAKASLDATTLAARFGDTPPIHIDPQSDFMASETLPDMTSVLGDGEGQWITAGGVVRSVSGSGKNNARGEPLALVTFRDDISTYSIESCYETGKIKGVSFDSSGSGHVDYESVCHSVGTQTDVKKVPPVLVPKAEAQGLKPGEVLVALVGKESREGLVLQSTAQATQAKNGQGKAVKTPVLQVRSHRVGGH